MLGNALGGIEAARLFVRVTADTLPAEAALGRMDARVAASQSRLGGLPAVAKVAGLGLAAGLLLSASAAITWESSFAGVEKTVDASAQQLGILEGELRGMAREMPLGANAIAAVAEQAGALGVKTADISEFTRVASLIGITTNVSADQAATSLGQLSNVLGLRQSDYERFGSTLVDLGNKGASTEADILGMATRAGSGAALIGLAAHETLGWSSAVSNLGIEVEAGGSSLQNFFLKATKGVSDGGAQLETYARTAGMTGAEFKRAFEQDAGGALEKFIVGMGDLDQAQQLAVLSALGFNDIRITRTLLGLAGNTDNLSDSLGVAETAWRDNNAMQVEAEKRFATTASKIQVMWNNVVDLGITLGKALLPAIGAAADALGWIATALAHIPAPVWLGIATAIGVALVPALFGAAVALGAVVIAALPIIAPFVAIGAAVAVLAWAFESNFLGIQQIVGSVFDFIGGIAARVLGFFIGVAEAIVGVAANIPGPWQDAAKDMKAALEEMHADADAWRDGIGTSVEEADAMVGEKLGSSVEKFAAFPGAAADSLTAGGPTFDASVGGLVDGLPIGMQRATDEAGEIAASTPGELAGQLRAGLDEYDSALQEIVDMTQNSVSDAKELAKIEATLASQGITEGLMSDSTRTRLMAMDFVNDLVSDYNLLAPGALQAGSLVNPNLQSGVMSNLGLATSAGEAIGQSLGVPISYLPSEAYGYGSKAGASLAKGVSDNANAAWYAGNALAGGARGGVAAVTTGAWQWGANVSTGMSSGIRANATAGWYAGNALANSSRAGVASVTTGAYSWGFNVGASFAAGLRGSAYLASSAAQAVAAAGGHSLRGYSPPREGPLKNIDRDAFRVGAAWAHGLGMADEIAAREARHLAAAAYGALNGPLGGMAVNLGREIRLPQVSAAAAAGGGNDRAPVHIVNHFGADSVRSDQDIETISRRLAQQIHMTGPDRT